MNMKLCQPIEGSDIKLNHRLVMAPMTHSRSTAKEVPDLNVQYYAQRASMALISTTPYDEIRATASPDIVP